MCVRMRMCVCMRMRMCMCMCVCMRMCMCACLLLGLVWLFVVHRERVKQRIVGEHRLKVGIIGPWPRLRRARLARNDRRNDRRNVSSRCTQAFAKEVDELHFIIEIELQAAYEEVQVQPVAARGVRQDLLCAPTPRRS